MTRSLGFRLFAGAAVLISLALLLTWLALTRLFEVHVAAQIERELVSVIDTLAANVDREDGALKFKLEPSDSRFTIPAGGRYWQAWLEGAPLLRSRSLWDTEIKYSKDPEAYGNLVTMSGPAGAELLAFSQKLNIEGDNGAFDIILTAAADRSAFDESVAGFNRSLLLMLALTALSLLLAAALQIRFGLRPLGDLSRAVANVRTGKSNRIDEAGPLEVQPLVSEINTLLMAERAAVVRARARAADLAHGLKTPLTILSQISESLAMTQNRAVADQIQEQVGMIRSRTDRQLALARVAGPGSASVDIRTAVEKLVSALKKIGSGRALDWTIIGEAGLLASVDPEDFTEAAGNILDNARAHAKSRIVVTAARNGRFCSLTVDDDGSGIAGEDMSRMLERGQRLDETDGGTGLGLAITSDIARAYGGLITLGASSIGGLSVTTTWPLSTRTEEKRSADEKAGRKPAIGD